MIPSHHLEPLTPLTWLRRSAEVYATRVAVLDGELRLTYAELYERARRLSGALAELGLRSGGRVALMLSNSHEMLEAHFGIPLAGGVIVPMNPRLTAAEAGHMLSHSGAQILIHDASLGEVAAAAAAASKSHAITLATGEPYESAVALAMPFEVALGDESDMLAINYTSGTTGGPKGAVYTYRGAYLQALAMVAHAQLNVSTVYLWTLPMFHCNGWSFPWAVTAVGGTHVCILRPEPELAWATMASHRVTHMCAAPTVLSDLLSAPSARRQQASVWVGTGGAPPTPTLLGSARALGLHVVHMYGMTETYGPIAVNEFLPEWEARPSGERDQLNARQGIANLVSESLRVIGPLGEDVPADGTTLGELAVRGNNVMVGYFADATATLAAIPAGWLRTGDLAVRHPDRYVEIRDRSKDVIVSGGENISSVEVEHALASHPDVLEAAVVGAPHERWGERPVAFVVPRPGRKVDGEALRAHLEARLARFKIPDRFEFTDLPKTATGKIQKFALKARASGTEPNGDLPTVTGANE